MGGPLLHMKRNIAIKLGKSSVISGIIQRKLFERGFKWNFGTQEVIKTADGYHIGLHITELKLSGDYKDSYYTKNNFDIIDATVDLEKILEILETAEMIVAPDDYINVGRHSILSNGTVIINEGYHMQSSAFDELVSIRTKFLKEWSDHRDSLKVSKKKR